MEQAVFTETWTSKHCSFTGTITENTSQHWMLWQQWY